MALVGETDNIRIAIFASRETVDVLSQAVDALLVASPIGSTIDVLVNGNALLADQAFERFNKFGNGKGIAINVWKIAYGDKANAWNQHIHQIWKGESFSFYIDGYVRVQPDAIASLIQKMRSMPDALGGTGVPSIGRSARQLREQALSEGGFHGNLCCIRGGALAEMRQRDICLPLGLYRTDSTIGAFLSFGLNPAAFSWNPSRFIAVDEKATWLTDEKRWWRFNDVKSAIKRRMRQTQGRIENRAIRNHLAVLKRSPESIPTTVVALVMEWVEQSPEDVKKLVGNNLLMRRAMRALLNNQGLHSADIFPVLM